VPQGPTTALCIRGWQPFAMEPASGFYIRSALAPRKQSLLCAFRFESGGWHTQLPFAMEPASGFYIRSALASRKRTLLRTFGAENGDWHTRLPAGFNALRTSIPKWSFACETPKPNAVEQQTCLRRWGRRCVHFDNGVQGFSLLIIHS
jgi:hypothetical protein